MTETRGRFRETGVIHVWHGRVPDQVPSSDLAVLSEDELRVTSSRSGVRAAHYAGVHAAVRRVLGHQYLGVPAEAVRFGRHACPRCADPAHGRPRIEQPVTALDFSLSRSGPYWLLAVTAGEQVGVDIERHTAGPVAETVLTEDELDRVRRAERPEERRHLFLRAWTRKEAVLKACGVGIVAELCALDTSPADAGPVTVEYGEPGLAGRWHVQDLALAPGIVGALAQDAGRVRLVVSRQVPDSAWHVASLVGTC
ncbi:4'-phosphopantetheinyl transferase family protein [Streptomyces afghaniensis]|uniref:4'-phosphopantetheinyl transferase family protein n=1 Tax=Streptomyces afghaniensis TaxID=66865 RepID=UPI0037A28E2C